MSRLPHVDQTRRPMRRPFFKQDRTLYLPEKQRHFTDISPEEIEARYQRRLAELRAERLQTTGKSNAVSEG